MSRTLTREQVLALAEHIENAELHAHDISKVTNDYPDMTFADAYDVNVAGTHVLTHALMPLLLRAAAPPPRLLFVTGLSQITRAAERYFPTPPLPAHPCAPVPPCTRRRRRASPATASSAPGSPPPASP